MSTLQPPTSAEILQSSLTDTGSVLADLSPEDNAAIHRLTTGEKYAVLKHHRKPSATYTFPRMLWVISLHESVSLWEVLLDEGCQKFSNTFT